MGRRDYAHKEPKKVKKDARKAPQVSIVSEPVNVEVIGKGKRKSGEETEK